MYIAFGRASGGFIRNPYNIGSKHTQYGILLL